MTRRTRAILPMAFTVALDAAGCSSARVPQPALYAPASAYKPTSPEAEQRDLPVTVQDLAILERADAILNDPARWNRHDNRICTPEDTTWTWCEPPRRAVGRRDP